jgi:hypothetical protein
LSAISSCSPIQLTSPISCLPKSLNNCLRPRMGYHPRHLWLFPAKPPSDSHHLPCV